MFRAPEALFLGSQTNKIDAKGRIAMPANFRRALDLKTFNGFFAVPALEGSYLTCGGSDMIAREMAAIAKLPPRDPDRQALEVMILGRAKQIMLDGEGRFILPEDLRDYAKLDGAAFFLGAGLTFHIRTAQEAEQIFVDHAPRAAGATSRLENPDMSSFYAAAANGSANGSGRGGGS